MHTYPCFSFIVIKVDLFQPIHYLNSCNAPKFHLFTTIENASVGYIALLFAEGIVNISNATRTLRVYWSLVLVLSTGHERGAEGSICVVVSMRILQVLRISWDWTFQAFISFSMNCEYIFCSFISWSFDFFMCLRILCIIDVILGYISCKYCHQPFCLLFCCRNFFTFIDPSELSFSLDIS